MSFDEFHGILRALYNIDRPDFEEVIHAVDVAEFGEKSGLHSNFDREWPRFRADPPRWFIAAPALEAKAIWKYARSRTRHYHVANQQDGDLKDNCALCGHDLRHSIHLRVGEER